MIFELQGELTLDPKKKTIAFMDKGAKEGYSHIYGAARVIKEKLRDQFNIITIGFGCGLTNNYYEIKRQITRLLPSGIEYVLTFLLVRTIICCSCAQLVLLIELSA